MKFVVRLCGAVLRRAARRGLALGLLAGGALGALLSGCTPPASASVYIVESASYGKGLFVVAPFAACNMAVKGPKGEPVDLDCSSQYIIRCDNDIPKDKPFCELVREIGIDRESVYPASKR